MTTTNIREACIFIQTKATSAELSAILAAYRLGSSRISRTAAAEYVRGDLVEFDGPRGSRVTAKVEKINDKSLSVVVTKSTGWGRGHVKGDRWKVSASVVEKAKGGAR